MRHRSLTPPQLGYVLLAFSLPVAVGCSPTESSAPASAAPPAETLAVAPTPTAEPTAETVAPSPPATSPPDQSPPSTASPRASLAATGTPTVDVASVKVYLLLEHPSGEAMPRLTPVHRDIAPTLTVGRAALDELLRGPTEDEQDAAIAPWILGSAVHPETRLIDLEVAGGTATVNLSAEFLPLDLDEESTPFFVLSLAQVTYTLTQFPTVERVAFRVEGEPFQPIEGHEGTAIDHATRDAYFDQLGPIFIDEPAWGSPVSRSLTVMGRAQILDADFEVAVVDAGTDAILVERTVTADCGPVGCTLPGGGEFQVELEIPVEAAGRDLLLRASDAQMAGDEPILVEYPLR